MPSLNKKRGRVEYYLKKRDLKERARKTNDKNERILWDLVITSSDECLKLTNYNARSRMITRERKKQRNDQNEILN